MALEFDEMSRNAAEVQKRVLRNILLENATCEYLRACGVGEDVANMTDEEMVKRFKEKVPVASYSHFLPFIQRILHGDTSPILTSAPVPAICLSSGTSKGRAKYIPYFDGLKTGTIEVACIATAFRDRAFPITPGARILEFNFSSRVFTTKGGLRVGTATSHLSCDDVFKMRQERSRLTSCCPDEVVLTDNFEQGLYRYQLGDILRVTGFYNDTPQLAYVCRKDVILSINVDRITEEDLGLVMRKVSQKLQDRSTMKLVDYTSYANIKNISKNYVIFWEVEGGRVDTLKNKKVLADCATWMDASFVEFGYIISRKMNTIGALQLCVVKSGTFKKLLHCFMDRGGASITQYKTPRCIPVSSSKMLSILQENTIAKFLSSHTF